MSSPAIEMQYIRTLATSLRAAIVAADFSGCTEIFEAFPRECCSHASSLLLIFLHEAGIRGFRIIKGSRPDMDAENTGHEWVQREDTVVDITADQFIDVGLAPVIVGTSHWHKSLNGQYATDALFSFDIPYYKAETQIYHRIVATGLVPLSRPFAAQISNGASR